MATVSKAAQHFDAKFHLMCRASKIAHAPARQLVEMRRAYYAGALMMFNALADAGPSGLAIEDIQAALGIFAKQIGSEEELRLAAP